MNEFFERLRQQVMNLWQNMSPAQRFILVGGGTASFGILLYIIYTTAQPVMVPFGTFDPSTAAQIKQQLDGSNFVIDRDYTISEDGRSIKVDAQKRGRITLALAEQGLVGRQERGFAIFDEFDITTTEFEQRLRNLEALKSVMREMLRNYAQVEDVAISAPYVEKSIFDKETEQQSVSAIITLKPGAKLTDAQIKAIRGVIARGFPGLSEENIALTDQFMTMLTTEGGEEGLSTKQMQVELETERSLEKKIKGVLTRVLGADRFSVSVDVEFDWDNITENSEVYSVPGFDPIVKAQQTEKEVLKGEGIRPGGEPGVASNSPPAYQGVGTAGPVDYNREEQIVQYLADKKITDRIRAPYVKKLSTAVAVDGVWKEKTDTDGKLAPEYTARTQQEMDDIAALVRGAIGHEPGRNDLVEVRNIPWNREEEWRKKDAERQAKADTRRAILYAIPTAAILIIFAFGISAYRRHLRLQEEDLARQRELERQRALAAAEAGLAGEISLEEQERQEIQRRASSLARAKPQIVAELIRTWMSEESGQPA